MRPQGVNPEEDLIKGVRSTMKTLKLGIPAGLLVAGFLLCTSASFGNQEFAKKEGKSCTFCHAKVEAKDNMKKNLNAVGQCYDKDKSLAKCAAPEKK